MPAIYKSRNFLLLNYYGSLSSDRTFSVNLAAYACSVQTGNMDNHLYIPIKLTGDVANLQNALFRGSARISRVTGVRLRVCFLAVHVAS